MSRISYNEARMSYGRPSKYVSVSEWEPISEVGQQKVSPDTKVANQQFVEGFSYAPSSDLQDALAKALEDTKKMFGKE